MTVALSLGSPDDAAFAKVLDELVRGKVASRIAAQDPTVWGEAAAEEAGKRLSWVTLPQASQALVPDIATLEVELRQEGLDHVVLCGMGGSSLAPEVVCETDGVELTVLDSSDPDTVRAAIEDRLDETVVVVSSKSGGTVETDSQRRASRPPRGSWSSPTRAPRSRSPRGRPATGCSWPTPTSAAATPR
jgi:glucose-6-phosphate isomerase